MAAVSAKMWLSLVCVGAVSGTAGSLVGLGGSVVALPLLGALGLSAHIAGGSSMAAVAATASGGACAYLLRRTDSLSQSRIHINNDKHKIETDSEAHTTRSTSISSSSSSSSSSSVVGAVDVLAAVCLSATSSVTAVVGARLSKRVSAKSLRIAMSVFMLSTVPLVALRDKLSGRSSSLSSSSSSQQESDVDVTLRARIVQTLAIGTCSGVVAGLLGVGGGMITVPALCLFTDLDYQVALGTSLAAMFPAAIAGSITHFRQGTLIPRIAFPLALGSLGGSFFGGKVGKYIDDQHLKYGFCGMMAVLGTKTFFTAIRMVK